MMAATGFDDAPYRGQSYGEMALPLLRHEPPPEPQPTVTIPPWPEEERRAAVAEAAVEPEVPVPPTVWQIAEALGELHDDRPTPGPAVETAPLGRFIPPEVDWRAEEREAIRRNQGERLEHARKLAAEEEPARHPPPRRSAA
jgi:hypothetical protein